MSNQEIISVWGAWSKDAAAATGNVIPISIVYTPFSADFQGKLYKEILCRHCGAFFNKFCATDSATMVFKCNFCDGYSKLPDIVLSDRDFFDSTSMEYIKESENQTLTLVFVIDITSDSLEFLKSSLLQALALLPGEVSIGLIAFSKHVYIYDLQSDHVRSLVLRGDKIYDSLMLLKLLRLRPQQSFPSVPYFAKAHEFSVSSTIEALVADLDKKSGMRNERCTGNAINIAVELLRGVCNRSPARVLTFVAGAATFGQGAIASLLLSETLRAFSDIKQSRNIAFLAPAKAFYSSLSQKAIASNVCVDIISGSIDQCGLFEMECLTQTTGGYLLLYDSYSNDTFRSTLLNFFQSFQKTYYNCIISIQCNPVIKICGGIGLGYSHKNNNKYCSDLCFGLTNTNTWGIHAIDPNTSFTYFFHPHGTATSPYYLQITTKCQDWCGKLMIKITTVRYEIAGEQQASQGFSQETAAVVTGKLAAWKLLTEEHSEVVRWLDLSLIQLMKKFAEVGSNKEVTIPKSVSMFPQFMYYMRRAQFLNTFNISPDESAYYRQSILRQGVNNCMLMIEPVLLSYSFDFATPVPRKLESGSLRHDGILLLDTFFNVVVWYGKQICKWKEMEYQLREEYTSFKELLDMPHCDAQFIATNRFPVPRIVECSPGVGGERLLKARLDTQTTGLDGDNILSEVMSLENFIKKLKDFVVK